MPVERTENKVVLSHPKGASVEILLYGASVTSWKSGSVSEPEPRERLFVSSTAALDGSKPVRGGIPVVFPCFGAPSHPDHAELSQHGFARNETWSFADVVMDNDAGVSVRLTLLPNDAIKSSSAPISTLRTLERRPSSSRLSSTTTFVLPRMTS
ncbi:hypothetical protein PHLGIDRAFT_396343 [Phlebiopsis gigantea 11061_1 CR5-6]|uniref:Glucose-6-phosphate 1-epimerase n=1 Tax=Phlebiopsis gigantea (strain 11061_1 CR5-6) TaxID=745531 RepID=A0A0C3SDM1_PHLG1|nr:hypothetical protein PHLGIDRAFT_396343 [Phlebiopsis gigantea 11061_1 CR5-6]